ncbi:MAG: hypothetical protein O7H41_02710 [Planctomycetota bacterium]|nr:hypothetical protein [Planctomycetota bacterium]
MKFHTEITIPAALLCTLLAPSLLPQEDLPRDSQERIVERIEALWADASLLIESSSEAKVRKAFVSWTLLVDDLHRHKDSISIAPLLERLKMVKAALRKKKDVYTRTCLKMYEREGQKILRQMENALTRKDFDRVVVLYEEELLLLFTTLIEHLDGPLGELLGNAGARYNDALKSGGRLPSWSITRLDRSEPFPEVSLKISSPKEGETVTERNVSVRFELRGFELGSQTEGAARREIANSVKGQHVHLVVDNRTYLSCYDATSPFSVGGLSPGTHVISAFPCRSYHESVKTPGAFATVTFHVAKATSPRVPPGGPLLVWNRPRGEYTGENAKRILVDFYVSNAPMRESAGRYSVLLTVDGRKKYIRAWTPYFVEGLDNGEHTIELGILDIGERVPTTFKSAKTTIRVTRSGKAESAERR